jgi:signal peptidase I
MFTLLVAIVVAFLLAIRAYWVGPYNAASSSMLPAITNGDHFLVFKQYPTPERGDIVVYAPPAYPNTSYVHRLIGMPGDRIQMLDGQLHINGRPVERSQIEDYVYDGTRVKQWREILPNGVTHYTIDIMDKGFYDNTPVYIVPKDHYFMMGDNRDNSTDSRVQSRIGMVPRKNLIGRVFFCMRSPCR